MKVQLNNIKKSFSDNVVLDGINLTINAGEIVALAGENGAGKSTLMKILSGALLPDSGEILIDNSRVNFHRPQDAMSYSIRMIYQELNLVRDLSVAENLFIKDENHKYGRVFSTKKKMVADATVFLNDIGLNIDPGLPVSRLNVAEQQMVEISKSLVKEVKLLIMDEPTAALNKEETDRLFEQIRRLKQKGISIIYISHRLDEIFELADRVVILRDGKVVLEKSIGNVTQDQLVTAMVGKQVENFYPKEHNTDKRVKQLEVAKLTKMPFYEEISFSIYKGEVLGIAGLLGSGKSEILRSLFGDMRADEGVVRIANAPIKVSRPLDAIKKGIVFLTADRKQEGLIMDMSIYANLSIASINRFTSFAGFIKRGAERKTAGEFIENVRVKSGSPNISVRNLSGGNQQKVVFGKWMMTKPRVFIMEEPTRGVDVGAKTEIYRLINQLTREGLSVLLVSSDIPELVAMSDRVIVLRDGILVKELLDKEITQHNVLHYSLRGSVQ